MDAKALQKDLESLSFTQSLAKLELGKRLGKKESTHKKTERNEQGDSQGR